MSTILRRATLALAAAGAVLAGTVGGAQAHAVYVTSPVVLVRPMPVVRYVAPVPVYTTRVVVVRRAYYYR